ncbi:hypothetical protein AWC38_SpisGene24185 [Stylophora pistillata]|uniref:Uncharacterized protein n=1 Tax=Stylophora pistillata TaxID=50429 RepID=A0A2B4R0K7_STYPI|nr:hypothetical protein AWC38_SpisGene24185 [Stylophora pistillata]
MGRPVLERTFIRNVQLEPFTYICHVSYFVNRWAMEIACSNFSVCNIAIITAIRYLEVSLGHRLQWEPPIDLKPAVIPHLKAERTVKVEELLEDLLERNMVLRLTEELRRKVNVNLETVLKRFKELEAAGNLQKQRDLQQEKEPEWKLRKLESKLISLMKMQKDLNAELMLIQERHVRIIEKVNLEMLQNIILETKIELKEKRRMKLERRTSGLELESDLKDEIVFLLRSKRVLNLDKVFIRECMAQHLEPKLKEELKMLTEQERVLEHELIERNRGLEIDQQELSLKQGLKLPVDQREPPMDLKPAQIPRLEGDRTDKVEELLEDLLERDMVLGLTEELKRKVNLSIESVLRRIKELENMTVEHKVKSIVKTKCELKDELQWLIQLEESWQREELCEQRKLQQEKLLYEVKSKVKQVMDLRKKLNAELGHESMYEIVFLVRLKWVLNLEVAFIRECMAELGEKLSLEVKHLEPKLREEVELLLQRERVPEYELIGRNRGLQIDQPEVKLKQGLKLPVDRVHELQNKIACLEEIKRILETGHRRQELDQEESNLKQKLEFLLERERGSRHEMQYRDYQVLKFVLDQERRWKGELQEREENPVAFVNLEQELGREWIAETWKTWTWLSKCERGLTSTEFAWVRNRFHELKQLEVNLTAEEELESLLIKEGRMYDELTSDRVTEFDRTMERIFRDFELPQIYRTTEELGHLFACRQLFSSQFWEDWRLCLPGSKQSEIEESKKKNLETLQERKRELMHEMEMELNRKRDHEVKGWCRFCRRLSSLTDKGYKEASLTAVRREIIKIYPFVFPCQIWHLKTGRPVLERAFMRDVQLESFTYICHVSCFVNRWAMEIACSDFSVCNIAIITAIRYLEGSLCLVLQRKPPMDLKPAQVPGLEGDRTNKVEELLEDLLERDMVLGLSEELKRKVNLSTESVLRRIKGLENVTVEHKVKSIVKAKCELKDELQWLIQREKELEESWQRGELWEERELEQEQLQYQYRDYQVLKFVLDQERRWKGELQEREENPVAFLIERNRELEHERRDVHVNLEQELGREWIAETWKTWTLLSKCERELTSTEFAWVRNRFHELDQLDVNLTAEEELESLLIKEGRLYDELTSDSEPNTPEAQDGFSFASLFSTRLAHK